jgi:Histidine kinase-, DNA gyrase B-, and HSP90-like ATPase
VKFVDTPPKASILIESMRDVGYSLETALADVVDNSITAGATTVHLHVETSGSQSRIGIVDNGRGMTRAELIEAMRLGSRNPLEHRAERDLGRFGLGLKTASFSQCRRLTVVARKKGKICAATWDLDHVATTDQWSLQVLDDVDDIPFVEHLAADGALVLWERLDRAIEQDCTDAGRKHFIRRVDEAGKHLELVFHRFLSGEPGLKKVKMLVNDVPLKPFDPFHSAHPATIQGQTEFVRINKHEVAITAFTLPHHRNVSALEWDRYAGPAGYLKNQGFYLYREKRLIIHGTWFGMARQMELTKLARVRIDMPNGLDAEWHVDVKKAWARPPLQVRTRLENLIGTLGSPSRRIYTQRGRKLYSAGAPIWQRVQEDNSIVYRLNIENPILARFHDKLPESMREEFLRTIQAASAALPMDALFADLASSPENVRGVEVDDDSLASMLETTIDSLEKAGITREMILQSLRVAEPFRSAWDRTETLIEKSGRLKP